MGFFSGKKKISVSSVVYNLAGPEADRPDYLKSLVVRNVLTGSNVGMGRAINDGLLDGPGIKLRGTTRWATNSGYSTIVGQSNGEFNVGNNLDTAILRDNIPSDSGETVNLQTSSIGWGTYDIWAEAYVNDNSPALLNTEWAADFNETTNQITITYVDSSTVTFTPTDFDPYSKYIYATYNLTTGEVAGPVVTGPTLSAPFPDLTGWEVEGSTWVRMTYLGTEGDHTHSLKEIQYRDIPSQTYRIDTQDIIHKTWLPLQYFFYKEGGGNSDLDLFFGSNVSGGTFFPFVPLRLNNYQISEDYFPDAYSGGKRLLKRTLNVKMDELLEKIADNPSIGDIDYAYVNFGVSLNVQENSCKKYLYTFFKMLQEAQPTPDALGTWETDMAAAVASVEAWEEWKTAQGDNPLNRTPEPEVIPYPPMPDYSIRVTSNGRPVMNYDMLIKWIGISEEIGTGLGKPDAKFGELWFTQDGSDTYDVKANGVQDTMMPAPPIVVQHTKLFWQDSANTWRSLRISGLIHKNTIYGGKSVDITAWQALEDIDESGFIVPIHDQIYRELALVDSTQMSTACCFIVFNCYTITKQKWYQTGVFKVIVFLVQVYFYGLVQAVTTLVVVAVIEKVAVAIFGDKLGGLIVAIVNVYMMATSMDFSSMSSIELFDHFSKAQNLLALTKAVSDVVVQSINYSIMSKMEEMQEMLQTIEGKMKEIDRLTEQNFGVGGGIIDPMEIVTAKFTLESPDKFLQRTLMTGDDIVDLSMSMIDRFTELSTSTKLPI
jgi:hypothetical protein